MRAQTELPAGHPATLSRRPVSVSVIGAGILGLWQALVFARAGYAVTLRDRSPDPLATSASSYAGAMLAPDCEAEAAPAVVRRLGHRGLALWRAEYPGLVQAGSLVVAPTRDRAELVRFARLTAGHQDLDEAGLAALEPGLAGRYARALYFPAEAHVVPAAAMAHLVGALVDAGGVVQFGTAATVGPAQRDDLPAGGLVVDCRGLAARDDLPGLRGVRGERVVVRARDVTLTRPVRLLHPRHPLYVVPWDDGRFMIGATVIESEDAGPATVRSTLELLGAAYTLDPAFAEAEILDIGAGVRPAFDDNVPHVVLDLAHDRVFVNGAYRHGFLLAPVLAEACVQALQGPIEPHPLVVHASAIKGAHQSAASALQVSGQVV
ncbi:MAG: FAD-dependent oxidoreductase [Hyphomicrobiaceae bacterium]|nr:FAD-dependent oxidoreductase [Hyphomicrobiaceae bacterium]